MRLAFSGVSLAWLLLIVWAIPGGPIVDLVPDYSAAAVLGLLFALGAFGGSVGFMFLWRPAFNDESFYDFVHVLLGGSLLLRRRAQFKARLAAECRRARADDASVFLNIELFRAMREAECAPSLPSDNPVDVLEDFARHAGLSLHASATRDSELWAEAIRRAVAKRASQEP